MTRKIIVSRNFRKGNPFTAFIMSFFFTGLGQIYGGSIYRGIAFLLVKIIIILIPPFLALTDPGANYLNRVFFSSAALLMLQAAGAIDAFMKCILKKEIPLQKYNRTYVYAAYAATDTVLTLVCILCFSAFFSFINISRQSEPLFERNDIILLSRIPDKGFTHGEAVIAEDKKGFNITRIIALPGEKVEYKNSRFLLNGSELPLSIFSEEELHSISLTNYDVVSELNGLYKYPVIQSRTKTLLKIEAKEGQYIVSMDNRNSDNFCRVTDSKSITGRIEGILFSPSRKEILIKPFVPGE